MTDHPNADDYRNRAERAEAHAAELSQQIERFQNILAAISVIAGVSLEESRDD